LTKKFARRFVIAGSVIIQPGHRYFQDTARTHEMIPSRSRARQKADTET